MGSLDWKLLSPKFLLFVLQFVKLGLEEKFFTTVLVSAEGPVPFGFNFVAKHMRLQTVFDMSVITQFIVLSQSWQVAPNKNNEFIPLLVNKCFDENEIFADLVTKPLL